MWRGICGDGAVTVTSTINTHREKKHNLSSTRTSIALCVNSLWKYSEVQVLNYLQSLQKTILFFFPIQRDKCNGLLGNLKSESPVNSQLLQNDSTVDFDIPRLECFLFLILLKSDTHPIDPILFSVLFVCPFPSGLRLKNGGS